jgi:hypothetical protein
MASAFRFGPLGPGAVHLCVDMQTLFIERTDWHVPWLEHVLPAIAWSWPRMLYAAFRTNLTMPCCGISGHASASRSRSPRSPKSSLDGMCSKRARP